MIAVAAYSACFSRTVAGLEDMPGLTISGNLEERKTHSAAAQYAIRAAAPLVAKPLGSKGLVVSAGPSGSMVRAFDKAWRMAGDGNLLTGPGFGKRRSRRIHPFTLITSLQNQVAATLSMQFQLVGPCLNVLDATTSLACLLPNIAAMLARTDAVLLVFATAGGRDEEQAAQRHLTPGAEPLEGALCFLLTANPGLGYLELGSLGSGETVITSAAISDAEAAPVLAPGIALLSCIQKRDPEKIITLQDYSGFQTRLRWRTT